jgi:hypothetical protein
VSKGQVTVFIIIGMLLLALSVIVVSVVTIESNTLRLTTPLASDNIYRSLEWCNEVVSIEAAYHLGKMGGYLFFENLTFAGPYASVQKFNGSQITNNLSILEMQENYRQFILRELPICFREGTGAELDDMYTIITENLTVDVRIEDNKTIVSIAYPVNTTIGDATIFLNEFPDLEIPIRLGLIHDAVTKFLDDVQDYPDALHLLDIPGANISYIIEDSTIVIIVTDPISSIITEEGIPGDSDDDIPYTYIINIDLDTNPGYPPGSFDNSIRYSGIRGGCDTTTITLRSTITRCMTVSEWRIFWEDFCAPDPITAMILRTPCQIG